MPDAHAAPILFRNGVRTLGANDRGFRKFETLDVRDPFAQDRARRRRAPAPLPRGASPPAVHTSDAIRILGSGRTRSQVGRRSFETAVGPLYGGRETYRSTAEQRINEVSLRNPTMTPALRAFEPLQSTISALFESPSTIVVSAAIGLPVVEHLARLFTTF